MTRGIIFDAWLTFQVESFSVVPLANLDSWTIGWSVLFSKTISTSLTILCSKTIFTGYTCFI